MSDDNDAQLPDEGGESLVRRLTHHTLDKTSLEVMSGEEGGATIITMQQPSSLCLPSQLLEAIRDSLDR